MDEITRAGYLVSGRVQGVGFRWWTLQRSRGLGLGGTVRNRADGSVEVWAQGRAEAVRALRQALAEGPEGARVEEVRELEDDGRTLPGRFEIVR